MYVQRKLLYHRLIDDESGTYITDYIQSCVGYICALYLLRCVLNARRSASRGRESTDHATATTYCTILMLLSYSSLALCAALAHQFLQTVHPYNDWHDDMTWLIVWRMGLAISSGFALSLLLLPKFLLEQENLMSAGRKLSFIYYTMVGLLGLGIFAHSISMLWNETDPFRAFPIFAAIFTCSILNCIASCFVLWLRPRRGDDSVMMKSSASSQSCAESLVKTQTKERRPSSRSLSSCTESDGTRSTTDCVKASVRWDLVLRATAPMVFVAAGFAWFGFTKIGCSNNEDPAANGCPLPNHFNHNALMHVIHTFAILMFFGAEMLAMRRGRSYDQPALTLCDRQSSV